MTRTEIEIELEPGLRYTEQVGRAYRGMPARDCFLWKEGIEEAVSGVNLLSFRQRFGAHSIPCEGLGGVQTSPQFRRRGFISKLLRQALAGVSERVNVAILDGVEDVYEKFDFVTCMTESHLALQVRHIERMAGAHEPKNDGRLRSFSPSDLPAMVDLYNREHERRPGTHARPPDWNRLLETQTWQPGSELILFEQDGQLAGYAIMTGQRFGSPNASFVVDELTARDIKSAQVLLIELASRCWKMRIPEFEIHEPLDSTVGRAARLAGCSSHQSFAHSGGMMGTILDRIALLRLLQPELLRRLPDGKLRAAHAAAFAALCEGEILPDNQLLLRLLIGFYSWADALYLRTQIPIEYDQICHAWFPDGNTEILPMPYAHRLDRY